VRLSRLVMIMVLAMLLASLVAAPSAAARTLPRGIVQPDPGFSDPAAVQALINDARTNLRSSWIRFDVAWSLGEPNQRAYDAAYLGRVAAACKVAKAAGLKVVLTVYKVPRWASQSDLWNTPVPGYKKGYQHFYLPKTSSLDELRDFMRHLSALCGADVAAYECWNEPNLWMFLAPQKRGTDANYAVRRYRGMLQQFYLGVKAGNARATVIGGAFGPYGPNDRWRTSPQRFASQLKKLGGAKYMDAVSHHPYQAGTSSRFAPNRLPRWPARAVSLRNLNVILKLFPGKPVYLTEYGYNTKNCPGIGLGVGAVKQAQYLRQAYAYAAKNKRVKVMFWYLLRDEARKNGWTTGLRTAGGARKPAYYVFSKGTRLTLAASRSTVARGGKVKLSGSLTWRALTGPAEAVAGKALVLQGKVGKAGWKKLRTFRSKADGSFAVTVRPRASTRYRVSWTGVADSVTRTVRVR